MGRRRSPIASASVSGEVQTGASDPPVAAAEVRDEPRERRVRGTRSLPILDAFRFTRPVSIADMTAARDAIRKMAPDAELEVHSPRGELVHVEARWNDQIIRRVFEVV